MDVRLYLDCMLRICIESQRSISIEVRCLVVCRRRTLASSDDTERGPTRLGHGYSARTQSPGRKLSVQRFDAVDDWRDRRVRSGCVDALVDLSSRYQNEYIPDANNRDASPT